MSASHIVIDRVPLNLIGATTHARAERLARRVRDAVQSALPAALASVCGRELDEDGAYVFIDRLDVECAVGAHWTDESIARAFAERLAQVLLRERHAPGAVVFRDRPDLVAAFIGGLVDGRAFSRWWFDEFAGLRPLSPSAAIRTLITTEEATAWCALGRLAPDLLRRVVAMISAADATRILATLEASPRQRLGRAEWLIEALALANAALPDGPARLVMALASIGAGAAEPPSRRDLAALRLLDRLMTAARSGRLSPGSPEDLPATLLAWAADAEADVAEIAVARDLDAAPIVARLRACASPRRPEDSGEPAAAGYTPFGGALVLCVLLARLGWWHRWSDTLRLARARRPESLAAWAALAVAARALDPKQPARIQQETSLGNVIGVLEPAGHLDRDARRLVRHALWTAAPTMEVVASRRLEPLLRASARALLREFGARVPGCDGSTARYLRSQCLSMAAVVSADGTRARLGRAPLDVLLVLSGLKRADLALPDGRRLVISEDVLP